jgi:hypothetical protein
MINEYKIFRVVVDNQTCEKLSNISFEYGVSKAEIIRAAILNSKLTIKCRERGTPISDAKKGVVDKYTDLISCYLDNKVVDKLKKMRMVNDATSSEIIRILINITDFSKLNLRTQKVMLIDAKEKKQKSKKKFTQDITTPKYPNSKHPKRMSLTLDTISKKKIADHAKAKNTSCAEIIRFLIDQTNPDMIFKSRAEMVGESIKRGIPLELSLLPICIGTETFNKIKLMKFKLKTSYSEIVRTLITNTDFSKLNIRNIQEIISDAIKGLNKGKKYNKKKRDNIPNTTKDQNKKEL